MPSDDFSVKLAVAASFLPGFFLENLAIRRESRLAGLQILEAHAIVSTCDVRKQYAYSSRSA